MTVDEGQRGEGVPPQARQASLGTGPVQPSKSPLCPMRLAASYLCCHPARRRHQPSRSLPPQHHSRIGRVIVSSREHASTAAKIGSLLKTLTPSLHHRQLSLLCLHSVDSLCARPISPTNSSNVSKDRSRYTMTRKIRAVYEPMAWSRSLAARSWNHMRKPRRNPSTNAIDTPRCASVHWNAPHCRTAE